MPKRPPGPALTVDAYVAALRQLDRLRTVSWSPISPLAVLLRAGRESDDWHSRLVQAERVAEALTALGRRSLEGGGWNGPERSVARAGLSAEEVERFVVHYAEARRLAERYRRSGLRGRLQALLWADPLLSRLLGRHNVTRRGGDPP